jgi:hypothetical protein
MQQEAAPHIDIDLVGDDAVQEDASIHGHRPAVLANNRRYRPAWAADTATQQLLPQTTVRKLKP